jgi:hypothetical protein
MHVPSLMSQDPPQAQSMRNGILALVRNVGLDRIHTPAIGAQDLARVAENRQPSAFAGSADGYP